MVVVTYLCAGAFTFQWLETDNDLKNQREKIEKVKHYYNRIITVADNLKLSGMCDEESVRRELLPLLESLSYVHEYDSRFNNETQLWGTDRNNLKELWSFPNSVFYALTVATSTGYERVSPSTDAGRLFTVLFGLFGIPLLFITAADIGKFFSEVVTKSYSNLVDQFVKVKTRLVAVLPMAMRRKHMRDSVSHTQLKEDSNANNHHNENGLISNGGTRITDAGGLTAEQKQLHELGLLDLSETTSGSTYMDDDDEPQLPVITYFGIMLAYCAFGSFLFNWHESGGIWDFIYGFFFSFNAITTIGVGDIDGLDVGFTCMVVTFVIIGLAVITMCVDLASTQVKNLFTKIHYFGRTMRQVRDMFSDEFLEAMQYLSALKDRDKVTLDDLATFLAVHEKLKKRPFVPKNVYRLKFIDYDGIGLRPFYWRQYSICRTSSLTRCNSAPSLYLMEKPHQIHVEIDGDYQNNKEPSTMNTLTLPDADSVTPAADCDAISPSMHL